MSFPHTKKSLIIRLAENSAEDDWKRFLDDYWRPVCRFALRWGKVGIDDAEDIASSAFEIVIRKKLLARWVADHRAKLRTLLCSVVRRLIANRDRKRSSSERSFDPLEIEIADEFAESGDVVDAFYVEWAEERLQSAIESLLREYHSSGRGDYFRVLYGRICEGMSAAEVAECLSLSVTNSENYFKHARRQLSARLKELIRDETDRYCPSDEAAAEFEREWGRLGDFLKSRGGLDEAIRSSYQGILSEDLKRRERSSMTRILSKLQTAS